MEFTKNIVDININSSDELELEIKPFDYVCLSKLKMTHVDKLITLYGRVHSIRKAGAKMIFLILRNGFMTVQCVCNKKDISENFIELSKLNVESIVTLKGTLQTLPADQPLVKYCFYQNFEFHVMNVNIISNAAAQLPFNIDDANVPLGDESSRCKVKLATRLDNRVIDLRTQFNNAMFKCQAGMVEGYRRVLMIRGFSEIHTPKLLGTSTESGSSVFKLDYFKKNAFLAQSPQFHKQMMINADMKSVYEIGPVFRSENMNTRRHLCEFTGVDMEMQLSPPQFHYYEIIERLWEGLISMFIHIHKYYEEELTYIKSVHVFDTPVYTLKPLILNFSDYAKLLTSRGFPQPLNEDLTETNEKELGKMIKEKYNSDIFVLVKYPTSARPFYTKRCEDNPDYTYSYDFIFKGVEICSGSQRENDYATLVARTKELGMSVEQLEDYLNSFKYGSPPHGGGGFGLERILMLYFDLDNVRLASLFPRDPIRLKP